MKPLHTGKMQDTAPPPQAVRIMHLVINAAILIVAIYAFIVLFTGLDTFNMIGMKFERWSLAAIVIVLLILVVIKVSITTGRFSRDIFLSHDLLILFAVSLMIYLSNLSLPKASDAVSSRYLPFSILRQGNFDLDEFPFLQGRPLLHYIEFVKGHYVSSYPVGAPLLATPFYVPSALGQMNADSDLTLELEKLSAATLVALSVVMLYMSLRILTTLKLSLLLTILYALGTSSLSISSQALLQHAPSQLALTFALYCLLKGRSQPAWIAYAGFALSLSVICRPTDALIALPVAIYVFVRHRNQFIRFVLFSLPPVAFQIWYNATYFGEPLHSQFSLTESWSTPILQGLPGVLFSPARGLFFYSPFFAFSIAGMLLVWKKGGDPLLRYLSIGTILNILLYSKWRTWWGGGTYGPRLLADIAPILVLFLYPVIDFLLARKAWKVAFFLTAVWSIYAHAIGAYRPDVNYDMYEGPAEEVKIPKHFPTSLDAANRLAVAYSKELLGTLIARVGRPLELSFKANNIGKPVWLSQTPDGKGVVYLEWQWFNENQSIPGMIGQKPIEYNVYPGQSYSFSLRIDPPPKPGNYFLKLGLVSNNIGPFTDFGGHVVRYKVRVKRPLEKLWQWTDNPLFFYTKELLK